MRDTEDDCCTRREREIELLTTQYWACVYGTSLLVAGKCLSRANFLAGMHIPTRKMTCREIPAQIISQTLPLILEREICGNCFCYSH